MKTIRPKFDPKEEFLVAYYRSGSASGAGTWTYDLAVLLVGIGLFALGLFGDRDAMWSVIGFGLVTYRLVQTALASSRYDGVFTSIIDKYEAALDTANPQGKAQNPKGQAKQAGAGEPATRPDLESEGGDNPQPEAEERSR